MDRFAALEEKAVVADVDGVGRGGDEVHLDAAGERVVERVVREAPQVEVTAELAIDAREQIQIEGRGHALCIVIGGVQHIGIFLEIDADDHGAARPDLAAGHLEERVRLLRREIADGRAWEVDDPARGAAIRRYCQRVGEIGADGDDAEARKPAQKPLHRRTQRRRRDIDRHVDRGRERADKEAGLQAFAAAVFEERRALAGETRDVAQLLLGNRQLGARRVVLAQPADALEELAADGVVEVLGRQRLLRARQSFDYVSTEVDGGWLAADEARAA